MAKKINLDKELSKQKEEYRKEYDEVAKEVQEVVNNENKSSDILEIKIGDFFMRVPDDKLSLKIAYKVLSVLIGEIEFKKPQKVFAVEMEDEMQNISSPQSIQSIQNIPSIQEPQAVSRVQKPQPKVKDYNFCPVCQGKLKRKRIKQEGDKLRQKVICSKCKFQDELVFSV